MHLAEKYVYKHADFEHTPGYLMKIHFMPFFVYYFLVGIVLAILFTIPLVLNNILISLIAGALLYIMVKEFLPEKKEGQPLFFVLGMILFIFINLMIEVSQT